MKDIKAYLFDIITKLSGALVMIDFDDDASTVVSDCINIAQIVYDYVVTNQKLIDNNESVK